MSPSSISLRSVLNFWSKFQISIKWIQMGLNNRCTWLNVTEMIMIVKYNYAERFQKKIEDLVGAKQRK